MSKHEIGEIAFFGRITAGITHELKNVLAIIRESAGLMEDIMTMSPGALTSYQDKFQSALNKISNQVGRGVELTDRLNKFAHSSDEAVAKIDLHIVIEQLVALTQRFARLKNVVLKTDVSMSSAHQFNLVTRPVVLQMALFSAIECCLDVLPAGGAINISLDKSEGKYAVYVLCEGDLPVTTEFGRNLAAFKKWPVLQKGVASIEGSVELSEFNHGLVLLLPEEVSV